MHKKTVLFIIFSLISQYNFGAHKKIAAGLLGVAGISLAASSMTSKVKICNRMDPNPVFKPTTDYYTRSEVSLLDTFQSRCVPKHFALYINGKEVKPNSSIFLPTTKVTVAHTHKFDNSYSMVGSFISDGLAKRAEQACGTQYFYNVDLSGLGKNITISMGSNYILIFKGEKKHLELNPYTWNNSRFVPA